MQSPHDGRHSQWKPRSPNRHITDYLYDGLPSAARELLSRGASEVQSIAKPEGSKRTPGMRNAFSLPVSRIKVLLLLTWIVALRWGEKHVFRTHVASCRWKEWEQWPSDAHPHRLVLIADPQLIDPHTYPGRPWPLSTLTIRHTDQYMRRSFSTLERSLDPDTVFFLGDLFDGGREWSVGDSKSSDTRWHAYGQEYWLGEYDRFGKIFLQPWQAGTAAQRLSRNRRLVASLPGNHDLGLGNGIRIPVRSRFHTFFGHGNRIDMIGNHTFVSIDAVSLSAKSQFQPVSGDLDSELWKPTEAFLEDIKERKRAVAERALRVARALPENALQSQAVFDAGDSPAQSQWQESQMTDAVKLPTIVLSHVPFYRQPNTPCGPLRERWPSSASGSAIDPHHPNSIYVGYGHQYQNVLSDDLSHEIIEKVGNVKHIFSGDDHDYCEVLHGDLSSDPNGIPEITVKSTSWAMGVRKPGFLLVSLWNPLNTENIGTKSSSQLPSIQTHLCLLPDQLGIFIRYGLLLVMTLLSLGIRAFMYSRPTLRSTGPLLPLPVSTPTFSTSEKVGRGRADSASYASSANSNDSNGLAARSTASRSRPLSPANGYGFDHGFGTSPGSVSPTNSGLLSPLPEHTRYTQSAGYASEDKKDSSYPSDLGNKRKVGLRSRPWITEFLLSVCQVGSLALLWYAWLAYSV